MAHLDRREGRKGAPICGLATAGSILYGVFNNGKMELIPTRHVGPESRGEVPGDRPRDALNFCKNVRQIVQRLEARRECFAMMDRRGGGDGGESFFVPIRRPELD